MGDQYDPQRVTRYGAAPLPPGHAPAPLAPPAPTPSAPESSGRAWLWLAGYVPVAPILVNVTGLVLYLCVWLAAVVVVALTGGALTADPAAESWTTTLLSGDGFSAWMGATMVLALWSLLTMVVVGALALLAITRGATTRRWRPFAQASAAAGIAFLPAAAVALLPLLV